MISKYCFLSKQKEIPPWNHMIREPIFSPAAWDNMSMQGEYQQSTYASSDACLTSRAIISLFDGRRMHARLFWIGIQCLFLCLSGTGCFDGLLYHTIDSWLDLWSYLWIRMSPRRLRLYWNMSATRVSFPTTTIYLTFHIGPNGLLDYLSQTYDHLSRCQQLPRNTTCDLAGIFLPMLTSVLFELTNRSWHFLSSFIWILSSLFGRDKWCNSVECGTFQCTGAPSNQRIL